MMTKTTVMMRMRTRNKSKMSKRLVTRMMVDKLMTRTITLMVDRLMTTRRTMILERLMTRTMVIILERLMIRTRTTILKIGDEDEDDDFGEIGNQEVEKEEVPPTVDCWQVSLRPPVCFDHLVDNEDDNCDEWRQ